MGSTYLAAWAWFLSFFMLFCHVYFSDSTVCFNYHRNYHTTSYLVCIVSLAYLMDLVAGMLGMESVRKMAGQTICS